MATMNATTRHGPSASASMSMTNVPMRNRYDSTNMPALLSRTKPSAPSESRHTSVAMTVRAMATAAVSMPP